MKAKKKIAKSAAMTRSRDISSVERVNVEALKPHPRNYKNHPEDQLQHLGESLKQHGCFRNVVVARDYTILAGHGVVEASKRVGFKTLPVVRLNYAPNDPAALKVLALDNELPKFAETDDRALTELLREVATQDSLFGTGYDDKMLAALVMTTRPASEIRNLDEAAEWVGMPEYDEGKAQVRLVVAFDTEEDRKRFVEEQGMRIDKFAGLTWSTRWPFTEREDVAGIRFEADR